MRIAERIGCSIQRAKAETTTGEFFKWIARFEEEQNEREIIHWYIAQLCWVVDSIPTRIFGGKFTTKVEDFLLKFEPAKSDRPTKPGTEIDYDKVQKIADAERRKWFGILGLDQDGKRRKQKRKTKPSDRPGQIPKPVKRAKPAIPPRQPGRQ